MGFLFLFLIKKSFAIYILGLSVNLQSSVPNKDRERGDPYRERDCIQTLTQTWDHCPVHKIRAFSWTTRSESAAPLSFLSLSLLLSFSKYLYLSFSHPFFTSVFFFLDSYFKPPTWKWKISIT